MSARILGATIRRIAGQLRHDPRTLALLLGVPLVLLTLLNYMYSSDTALRDRLLLIMLGLFPFTIMFVITSVAMLRERTSGTLERLMTTPTGRLDLLFGYGLTFGLAAVIQAAVSSAFAFGLLGMTTRGSVSLVVLVAVLCSLLGVGLGLLGSAFARTEFQAVQFIPLVIIPQTLLSGLFVPREEMADWLHAVSDVLPLSYAVQALTEVGAHASMTGLLWRDLAILAGCVVAALALAAGTLPRRTP